MIERLNGSTDERKAFVACNSELEKKHVPCGICYREIYCVVFFLFLIWLHLLEY